MVECTGSGTGTEPAGLTRGAHTRAIGAAQATGSRNVSTEAPSSIKGASAVLNGTP